MFYRNHNNLFSQNDFSSYLRAYSDSLSREVKGLALAVIKSKPEQELINELTQKYSLYSPTLREDEIKIDAGEAEVEVYNQYRFDNEPRTRRTTGLKITVQIPFDGNPELFNCRASTFSLSGTPEGTVEGQNLILYYETAEKDAEKIKELWKKDINEVKQNLGWLAKDASGYNNSLENTIKTLLANREKEAEDSQALINKIKI